MSLPLDIEARLRGIKIGLPNSLNLGEVLASQRTPAADSVRVLPETVSQILNSPNGVSDPELINDIRTAIMYASLLRPIDKPLQATAVVLSRALDPNTPVAFPHTRSAALVLSTTLTYQTSLPLNQKTIYTNLSKERGHASARRITTNVQDELTGAFGTNNDTSLIDQLQTRSSDYQTYVLKSLTDANLNQTSQADLLTALNEADPIADVITGIFDYRLEPYTSPSYKQWRDSVMKTVGLEAAKNPHVAELLSKGQLEHLGQYLRIYIWNYLPLSSNEDTPLAENPTFAIAGNYFITHPDVQRTFWTYLSEKGSEVLINGVNEAKIDPDEYEEKGNSFLNTSLLMQWAIGQDRNTFRAFVDTFDSTAPDIDSSAERNFLIGRMIFIASQLKNTHPGNENLDNLISRLKGSVELFGLQKEYGEAVEIASDQAPGIIYQRLKGGLGFQAQREGQTKEELIAELTKKNNIVVYISSAPWEEKKPDFTKHLFVLTRSTILAGLGQVGEVIDPRELPNETRKLDPAEAVLPHLARTMVYPRGSLQAIDSIQASGRNPRTLARLILFPDMLPVNHPLRLLSHSGIVAVSRYRELTEPNSGVEEFETTILDYQPPAPRRRRNSVDLVINSKRADGVNVVSSNETNLWLQGELYGGNLYISQVETKYIC